MSHVTLKGWCNGPAGLGRRRAMAHETRDPERLKIYEIVKGKGKTFEEVKRDLALEEVVLKAKGGPMPNRIGMFQTQHLSGALFQNDQCYNCSIKMIRFMGIPQSGRSQQLQLWTQTPNDPLNPVTSVVIPKYDSEGSLTLAKTEPFTHPNLEITVSSLTNYDGILKLCNKLTETLKLSSTLDFTLSVERYSKVVRVVDVRFFVLQFKIAGWWRAVNSI
ncbi:hypothetical protein K435DRAFT_798136 [Dendrothele bispora CBS 962.96]|uniref:Uncharacterized protein n=1 Tax=Dendrothele bispora (strain CBS 962.96) TaxID=1314807 RepID=A0A4S8M067_DENBC|nr:hypothetical protein K435DRAFT_798136 [Dendrothele bispora CBS 962.96]